jgi:hypothetical protein
MPLVSGARLGPYEIVALIGVSGMGEVYRARDPKTICARYGSRGATWGRGGVILFTAGTLSPLLQVSADGGEAVPVTNLDPSRGGTSCFCRRLNGSRPGANAWRSGLTRPLQARDLRGA